MLRDADPRCRLIAVMAATLLVVTTPAGALGPFAAYALLLAAWCWFALVPPGFVIRRSLAASPFLLLAGAALWLREGGSPEVQQAALKVVLSGWLAAALLALLSAWVRLPELLWALRKLHAPDSFCTILTLMTRYIRLVSEEYSRLSRARESRTSRPTRAIHVRQIGALILRTWDRAERVHAAMVSRGFEGHWPVTQSFRFASADAMILLVVVMAFSAARFL